MFDKDTVKIAISPISWSNDDDYTLGGDISFEQCIDEMAEAGYAGCEVGHKFPRDTKVLHQALSKRHLQLVSQWFSMFFTEKDREQETLDHFIKHMQFLKAMGCAVIVVVECSRCILQSDIPVVSNKPIFDDEQWQLLASGLEGIGQLAVENGMRIVYHHHMGTGIQTAQEITRLMETTNPEFVSLLLDTGHLVFAGADPVAIVNAYGDRIKHVHLKDIRKDVFENVATQDMSFMDAVRAGVFTVPGDGCIDFAPIFSALETADYNGWFVVEAEQDPTKANPLKYARMARQTIREMTNL